MVCFAAGDLKATCEGNTTPAPATTAANTAANTAATTEANTAANTAVNSAGTTAGNTAASAGPSTGETTGKMSCECVLLTFCSPCHDFFVQQCFQLLFWATLPIEVSQRVDLVKLFLVLVKVICTALHIWNWFCSKNVF